VLCNVSLYLLQSHRVYSFQLCSVLTCPRCPRRSSVGDSSAISLSDNGTDMFRPAATDAGLYDNHFINGACKYWRQFPITMKNNLVTPSTDLATFYGLCCRLICATSSRKLNLVNQRRWSRVGDTMIVTSDAGLYDKRERGVGWGPKGDYISQLRFAASPSPRPSFDRTNVCRCDNTVIVLNCLAPSLHVFGC
jgi:hypothetical protein